MKLIFSFLLLLVFSASLQAKEFAGITVEDQIMNANNDQLVLNGMGLREKFWLDIYVGSLYLVKPSNNVAAILSQPGAYRIQLDFKYSKVTSKKLITAWKEGFEKNQSDEKLQALQDRMNRFYGFFEEDAVKADRYVIDYIPGKGTDVSKNNVLLGNIAGEDFKNALLEIWLGNFPADKSLKKGMLGLN